MGYWWFSGGDIAKAPKRYFHFVYAAGSKTNKIIDWNCDDDARPCQEFHESIPDLLKPPPPPSPPSFINPVCAKLAKIVYQPPQDYLVRAAKLADAAERQPFATTPPKQIDYRLKLLIDVGSDGIVYRARFSESSGSRLFDRAAQNWVYGFMFAPQDCGAANIYEIVLPVVISVQ